MLTVTRVPAGLPRAGREVKLETAPAGKAQVDASSPSNDTALWTYGMSDCTAIASIDRDTGLITLTHLPGGGMSPGFIGSVAANIIQGHPNTTIILASGTYQTEAQFERYFDEKTNEIIDEAVSKGYPLTDIMFRRFWTDGDTDKAAGRMWGSLVIHSDGRYGRAEMW